MFGKRKGTRQALLLPVATRIPLTKNPFPIPIKRIITTEIATGTPVRQRSLSGRFGVAVSVDEFVHILRFNDFFPEQIISQVPQ